jgi:hypothetical protein
VVSSFGGFIDCQHHSLGPLSSGSIVVCGPVPPSRVPSEGEGGGGEDGWTAVLCFERGRRVVAVAAAAVSVAIARSRGKDG